MRAVVSAALGMFGGHKNKTNRPLAGAVMDRVTGPPGDLGRRASDVW